jgi:hypothetical protein
LEVGIGIFAWRVTKSVMSVLVKIGLETMEINFWFWIFANDGTNELHLLCLGGMGVMELSEGNVIEELLSVYKQ